ncbi:MAG: catalase/peroxidase HPI [Fulvimarina manganoxydans]|uniref:catalase/peroxidase HPI n=1 Tax=Fulvimarina manganoxydans TaxID=937218 RepID=UPI002354342F|nr:catalase/peroxidase HPI [Fulvimarina manganoxydans]MCK5932060.1 catalase/peroxidase HPI [Fulvimarina manganoxydans]
MNIKADIPNRGQCPFGGTRIGGAIGSEPTLEHWWPNRLKVEQLHQNPAEADPLGRDFDYAKAFKTLDLEEVKKDIKAFLTSSVSWWPSDYGNYGPQMVRMAWHSAGTYRRADGRGGAGQGMQRFAPVNSWWDNGNTDKSRRLLWPIKQKYGTALSWSDLMILAGNCSLEIMGFPTFGYAGGRVDAWEPDTAIYWGPEGWNGKKPSETTPGPMEGHPNQMVTRTLRWEGEPEDDHYDLENPLAASHQSLIYVDPEGPNGNGDPMDSARDIRITFGRMAMNDEETVALIAGGHAFGKSHGMVSPNKIGPAPEGAPIEAMGLGWQNPEGTGFAQYTMTNGIEGSWTPNPTKWDNDYLTNLFKFEWEKTKSPAGATQWTPTDPNAPKTPDAHTGEMHPLMMMTSDLALKVDPDYRKVCEKFLNDFDAFTDAFARAWFKLVHRDMGPKSRYLGPEVPAEDLLWQDPIPDLDHETVNASDVAYLKAKVLDCGLSVSDLVFVAWSAASTHRVSDKRGGANGGRIALEPQNSWEVNDPARTNKVLEALRLVADEFNNAQSGNKRISLADMVVLAGCAGVEKAAKDAGVDVEVPFTPGRMDTTQELTDVEQFDWLQPVSDGFRNYHRDDIVYSVAPEQLFLDRAALLSLTAPQWTALVGGLRVLGTNWDGSKHGVFTDRPGVLSNDFFLALTDMSMEWRKADEAGMRFTLNDRESGTERFTATRCDLIFGSNAQLRQIVEVYAGSDGHGRFVKDFVAAWTKVMMLDRYDLAA